MKDTFPSSLMISGSVLIGADIIANHGGAVAIGSALLIWGAGEYIYKKYKTKE